MNPTKKETGSGPPRSRKLRIGGSLIVLGTLLGVYAGVQLWPIFGGLLFNPTHSAPGEFEQELDEGEYLVSIQTSFSTQGPVRITSSGTVDVLELTITNPDGAEVRYDSGRNQSINRNGDGFSGLAVFTASEPGTYEFRLSTSVETNALVTTSLTSVPLVTVGLGGAGSIAFLTGLVLVIIWFAQRRREGRLPPPPTAYPWPDTQAMPPDVGDR